MYCTEGGELTPLRTSRLPPFCGPRKHTGMVDLVVSRETFRSCPSPGPQRSRAPGRPDHIEARRISGRGEGNGSRHDG